jgi:hypothetical protein
MQELQNELQQPIPAFLPRPIDAIDPGALNDLRFIISPSSDPPRGARDRQGSVQKELEELLQIKSVKA